MTNTSLGGILVAAALAAGLVAQSAPDFGHAKVKNKELRLRCFGTERSPTFEDALAEGEVLEVAKAAGVLRLARVPMGPTGYVAKRFTSVPEQGIVRPLGSDVAFRYRPVTGEAPVTTMAKDTALVVVGEAGEWWKVRHATAETWVSETEVEFVTDAAAAESLARLEARRRAEAQEGWTAIEKTLVAKRQVEEARGKLVDYQRRLVESSAEAKGDRVKQVEALNQLSVEVGTLAATLTEGSEERKAAEALRERIDKQALITRALVVRDEPLRPDKETRERQIVRPATPDPLARFAEVGWIRVVQKAAPAEQVRIEKGGQVLAYLVNRNRRYDLRVFDGAEVGITGVYDRDEGQTVRTLNVDRMEVITAPRLEP
ncbi:MAG: hypothetical protein IT458_02220 [Planctomycetes bacterium]|nr:hypothetical protein [Planctomycetota bacterium]